MSRPSPYPLGVSTDLVPFVFGAALVGMVVMIATGIVHARRRRDELAAFAAERGWSHVARDDGWTSRFGGPPFGRGTNRQASNVLTGVHDGRAMVAFDYRYDVTTGTGENRSTTTYHHSVVGLAAGAVLPALSVSPEGLFGRLVSRLANTDIELEYEEFNRAFTVTCPDRKFASDVLHPRLMTYLLRFPDLAWRFEGDTLLVVRRGRHTPDEVSDTLRVMDDILEMIPEFVWREVRGR